MATKDFDHSTTAETAAQALKSSIQGKNVLITGVAPESLGGEAVRVIYPYAKNIIIASRSPDRAKQATANLSGGATLHFVALDLLDLKAAARAAQEVNALNIPIDVVINNAAVTQSVELTRTKQGFESQFGANHLGHFVFTNGIIPSILAAAKNSPEPARIVNISSLVHHYAGIRWDDPNYEKRPEEYSSTLAYGQSKTANILHALGLAEKYKDQNVVTISVHPGGIRSTNMGQTVPLATLVAAGLFREDGTPVDPKGWKEIPAGTSSHIVAAFDPQLSKSPAGFINDCQLAPGAVNPHASDKKLAADLWTLSEKLVATAGVA